MPDTCTLTGVFCDPDGTPFGGAKLVINPAARQPSVTGELIVAPVAVSGFVTDQDGSVSIELAPGLYRGTATQGAGGRSFQFDLAVPNLETAPLADYIGSIDVAVQTSAQRARDEAVAAAAAFQPYLAGQPPVWVPRSMDLAVTADWGLSAGDEAFLGSWRVSQGLAVALWQGVPHVFILQAVDGSTGTVGERRRIVFAPLPASQEEPVTWQMTAPMHVGHQQISPWASPDGLVFVGQFPTQAGHEGVDAGKGVSVITFRGAATTDADVRSIQLFGWRTSGHPMARYHSASPAVSADGATLILWAQDVQPGSTLADGDFDDGADVPPALEDSIAYLMVYDFQAVLAAEDGLAVEPLRAAVPVAPPAAGERLQYTQGMATDGRSIWVQRGYSAPMLCHALMQYDLEGNHLATFEIDGPRALYDRAALLGGGGRIPRSFEPEGIALWDGRIYWLAMDDWRALGDVVSFEGQRMACIADTTNEPPRHELRWTPTTVAPGGAWVRDTPYLAGAYVQKRKSVWSIRSDFEGAYRTASGKSLPPSGASLPVRSNGPDITYDEGERLMFAAFSQVMQTYYPQGGWSGGRTWEIRDTRPGANMDKRATITTDFRDGRSFASIRAAGSLLLGAGIDLYGADDALYPGRAIFKDAAGGTILDVQQSAINLAKPAIGAAIRALSDAMPELGLLLAVSTDTSLIYKGALTAAGAIGATHDPGVYRISNAATAVVVGSPGDGYSGGVYLILRSAAPATTLGTPGDGVGIYIQRTDAAGNPRLFIHRCNSGVWGAFTELLTTGTKVIPRVGMCRFALPAPLTLTGAASTTLALTTIDAGLLGPAGFVDIDYQLLMPLTANNKTYDLKIGGTTIVRATGTNLASQTAHRQSVRLWAQGAVVQGRPLVVTNSFGNTNSATAFVQGAINFDGAQALTMDLGLANTAEALTLQALTVSTTWMPAAA